MAHARGDGGDDHHGFHSHIHCFGLGQRGAKSMCVKRTDELFTRSKSEFGIFIQVSNNQPPECLLHLVHDEGAGHPDQAVLNHFFYHLPHVCCEQRKSAKGGTDLIPAVVEEVSHRLQRML